MANVKISALPVATTPLAGTEVLPIVQTGVTAKVSVANLTAGRAISASGLTLTNALPIASGGTGQTTANAAFNALAPSQTGNSGKYLTTDGTNTSWGTNPLGTVTNVSGTAPISVATGTTTPVISMPAATSSVNGYLTSTDWTTFNNKSNTNGTVTSVAALTIGTTGTDLSSTVATGTTTPVITLNVPTASATNRGVLSSADWTTFNNKGAGTVTSVTGTAPVVSSGGATPAISMAAATTSVNGYLTSTDWTTFNNKQATLVSGTNLKTVSGTSLLGSGDLGVITGTYGGTGVNNGASTITVGGNVTHAGAFTQSFTATANTAVTLPAGATAGSNNLLSSATPLGIVTGTPSGSNFLRGDGTWATPAGAGTVTSVAATVPSFLSVAGSPITSSGTLAITLSGTALPVANGGTGVITSTGTVSTVLSTNPTLITPKLGGATSGTVTLTVPAVAGTNTATFPAATGTVMVTGNMPAFSAYQSTSQTALANSTFTKIEFQTEEYDTNNNFDNATNYRFTPTVAGYYQVNSRIGLSPALAAGGAITSIYKNGSEFKRGGINATTAGLGAAAVVSVQMYMNGSTDYVEIYAFQNCGSTATVTNTAEQSYFQACLVRGA